MFTETLIMEKTVVLDNLFQKKIWLNTHQKLVTLNTWANTAIFDNTQLYFSKRIMHIQLFLRNCTFKSNIIPFCQRKKEAIFKWRPYLIYAFFSLKFVMHRMPIIFKNMRICIKILKCWWTQHFWNFMTNFAYKNNIDGIIKL